MTFTVPGRPIPKARPRAAIVGKGTKRAVIYTPNETREYETKVKAAAEAARIRWAEVNGEIWPLHSNAYLVSVGVFSSNGVGDADNVFKSVADAMNGTIYWDDRIVGGFFPPTMISAVPRTVVSVTALDLVSGDLMPMFEAMVDGAADLTIREALRNRKRIAAMMLAASRDMVDGDVLAVDGEVES